MCVGVTWLTIRPTRPSKVPANPGRLARRVNSGVSPHVNARRHNKRLSQRNWYLKYFWSRYPARTLRGAIIEAANRERVRKGTRDWWCWHRVRLRMVAFYAANFGAVPPILTQRNLPTDRVALGRDADFKQWWPGLG